VAHCTIAGLIHTGGPRIGDRGSRGLRYSVPRAVSIPYDFVISTGEFTAKLSSDNLGWLIAGDCDALLRCTARQASEAVAIAPLGLLIAIAARGLDYRRLFVAGAALGLLLEVLQLLLVSGVSQGLSLLLRGAGLVAGAAIGRYLRQQGPMPVARLIRLATPFLAAPYLLVLTALSGWFSAPG